LTFFLGERREAWLIVDEAELGGTITLELGLSSNDEELAAVRAELAVREVGNRARRRSSRRTETRRVEHRHRT
jgi:hypothetical protein